MKNILTVACEIPGELGEYIEFDSKTSLLDADFVLFSPTLGPSRFDYIQSFRGKPRLSDTSSFQLQEAITHWKRELSDFLNAGKTVFVIMSDREEVYVRTGKKKYSGSGRNRTATDIVRPLSSYDLLPFPASVVESKGTSMRLHPSEDLLKEYWQQFGDESEYHVHIEESNSLRPLVVTRQGGRIVGAIFRTKSGGALVALPWINFYKEEFITEKEEEEDEEEEEEVEDTLTWTPKAVGWGQKYLRALESLEKAIRSQGETTPVPRWAQDDKFRTNQEIALSEELAQMQTKISDLERKREKVKEKLADAGFLKGLLFEQGHALENAILEAMRLMGFVANTYRDSDSEFDAVLECPEGRCIGEAEGRNNKPISIEKMRQLFLNIHEDLSREEVSDPAKGILFGNAHRLSPPLERPAEHFTAKCMSAAKINKTALIRTCDLFEVAKALIDEPDEEFAALCRKAIFDTVGEEVKFPARPETKAAPLSLVGEPP